MSDPPPKPRRPWSGGRPRHHNPPRGAPGILWTCEQGREVKCEREGREILQYYHHATNCSPAAANTAQAKLTLDQELASLQRQQRVEKEVFPLFDTGCQGTAIMLHAPMRRLKKARDAEAAAVAESPAKRPRTESETAPEATTTTDDPGSSEIPRWDPVATVQAVVQDITRSDASSSQVPGSRFITRMIPLQATCFASVEELQGVLRILLLPHERTLDERGKDATKPATFRIHVKRRNCGHLTTSQIIDAAAGLVVRMTGWTVQLKDSDFCVWVEVCKSFMGVSLLTRQDLGLARNFNLAELRDKHGEEDDEDDDGKPSEEADKGRSE
jgi:tRNA(Ser,Leu) C12 N-acetylase TAN1